MFGSRQMLKCGNKSHLDFGSCPIQQSKLVKYVGGDLDPNITFEEYVKQTSRAALLKFTKNQSNKTQPQCHCLQHLSVNAIHLSPGLFKCLTIQNQQDQQEATTDILKNTRCVCKIGPQKV